ncbi:MAG: response regulator transcription factor [Burkholderiales bacterium]|jgi:DNA-binding NarL/FixJ family response regulator|nr:response regulator transcription factor [Burkholderiales bacterium]
MMRDGLQAILQAAPDIEVVGSVGNGREAINRASALRPDVVIMDVTMPDMNGIEAAGLLRDKHPEIRIIMLSMHSSSEHVYRALNAGAAGYLLKESAGEEIASAVRAVHAGRSFMSAALETLERCSTSRADGAGPLASLSTRERQVLQLVVEGHSSTEIAALIHLSPKSVDTYRSRLMKKLGITDVTGLVKFAIQHGLTPPG